MMSTDQKNNPAGTKEGALPLADTGNASNPIINNETTGTQSSQLLGKEAEKYLREAGNIEDMPDPQQEEEIGKTPEEEK